MPVTTPLKLVMEYHNKSRRYRIKNAGGEIIQFPGEDRIYEIWNDMFPTISFEVVSTVDRPVYGFWVEVGPGTTPDMRSEFCRALALKCKVMRD